MQRIYLDVCCLNRPFDARSQPRIRLEAEAVTAIFQGCVAGKLELVGSEAIDYEVAAIPDPDKRQKVAALLRLAYTKVYFDANIRSRAEALVSIGFKPLDSLHLACAEAGSASVFLTVDDRLLGRARKLARDLNVAVNNPVEWLMGGLHYEH